MQPSAPTAQIDNITRITGDVGADGRAKQRIGLVDVVSASVRNETEIGGDVEAKGDSVQDVGVVKQ